MTRDEQPGNGGRRWLGVATLFVVLGALVVVVSWPSSSAQEVDYSVAYRWISPR